MASNVIHGRFRKTPEAKANVQAVTDDFLAWAAKVQQAQDEAYERAIQIEDAVKIIEQQSSVLFSLSGNIKLAEQRALGAIGRALMRAHSCGNE